MPVQYMSLAKALHTHGKEVAKKIPAADGAPCGEKELKKIQDLVDRGYRYIHAREGAASAEEIERSASKPIRLKPEGSEWKTVKKEVPHQVTPQLGTTCNAPAPKFGSEEYGFSFHDSWFYAKDFSLFGGRFGKKVFFEGMKINSKNADTGKVAIHLDSGMQSYNLGKDGVVIVGQEGLPIVEFDGNTIKSHVDVEIRGTANACELSSYKGPNQAPDASESWSDSLKEPGLKDWSNNFEGKTCG